jgi:hypothetical protein
MFCASVSVETSISARNEITMSVFPSALNVTSINSLGEKIPPLYIASKGCDMSTLSG